MLFVTSSRWGGWHHVEVHKDDWWILKYESYGFQYSEALTKEVRSWASHEGRSSEVLAPNGKRYNAQHIWLSMKVFINPVVMALPQHAHLLYKYRCITGDGALVEASKQLPISTSCNDVPHELKTPRQLPPEMNKKWEDRIKRNLKSQES